VAEILTDSVHAKFSKYDTSHAGVISTSDCASLLRELGESTVDAAGMARLTEELDADGSGLIDFREFLDWWQHHGMQRVFMRFDHDKSGAIDTHELSELLASLGLRLTPQQLQAAQSLLDPDGDGSISWAEYLKWWERFDVQRIFERYDADGSGAISARELQLLCADLGVHLSKREVKDALKKLDKDGSASLSFEEFFPWWCAISDLKCDSKLVVDYKGGRWEDNLFLHVDKLHQLKVDIGSGGDPLPIVTNAGNVKEGIRVVVATVGAKVNDKGEEIEVKKANVGGCPSEGMLCDGPMLGWTGGGAGAAALVPDTFSPGDKPPKSRPRMDGK
jgi:Ca2+-binding EF-hand superfamily protein